MLKKSASLLDLFYPSFSFPLFCVLFPLHRKKKEKEESNIQRERKKKKKKDGLAFYSSVSSPFFLFFLCVFLNVLLLTVYLPLVSMGFVTLCSLECKLNK